MELVLDRGVAEYGGKNIIIFGAYTHAEKMLHERSYAAFLVRSSDRGSPVVKVSDQGWRVMSSSPVHLKTRRVGARCTLNLSRTQTSSRWCDVVVRRGGASSGFVLVTRPWFKMTRSVAKIPPVAEQCDANLHSLTHLVGSK
ncbi:uncharacterized protein TNCV_1458801 [Trichonephila clavipes]|nr:uncharacterized protein TNCV_1458801 [Trichonephila clavipes]